MADKSGRLAFLKFKFGGAANHVADIFRRPADFFKSMRNRLPNFNGHLPGQIRRGSFQSHGEFFQSFTTRT